MIITTFLNYIPVAANAADDKLGIRVTVLPEEIKIKSQPYAYNEKLWFISTKNEPISRTIWVQEQVNSPQHISLELVAAKNLNGKISPDEKNTSILQDWITFSEKEFDLPARGQVKVKLTIKVPAKYKNFSQDAYVQVRVGSNALTDKTAKKSKAKIRMILPVKFQYAVPLFVGIGDIKNLVSFQIEDINGYVDNLGKFLEVKIKNDGLSPVEPSGNVQLSFADFEAKSLGPFNLKVKQIRPKETGYLIARVPLSVQPAKYKSLVQAQFGSFADAKIITKNLDFKPKSNFGLFNVFVILIGIIFIAFFGRKYINFKRRINGKLPLKTSIKLTNLEFMRNFGNLVFSERKSKRKQKSEDSILDVEIKEWLDSLTKSPAKKSPAKKSPAKKSPAKKSPAKKSPAKKSPAKKSPAKKSPAKKSPAKKSPAKKSPAKKSPAKKSPAKKSPRSRGGGN